MTKTIMIKLDNGLGDRNCEVVVSRNEITTKWRNGDCSVYKQLEFSDLSLESKDFVSSKLLKTKLTEEQRLNVLSLRFKAGLIKS